MPQACLRWNPPTRVLLATNLTDLRRTLPAAIECSAKFGAELRLVHILPDERIADASSSSPAHASRKPRDSRIAEILGNALKTAAKANVRCSSSVHSGRPAEILSRIAMEWKPDRVILGSQGARRSVLGPVAEAILGKLEVPVIAIGPAPIGHPWISRKEPRFLFATALERDSQGIAAWILDCARIHQAELTMLHVIPDIAKNHPAVPQVRFYAERMFRGMLSGLDAGGLRTSCLIERGRIADTICLVAGRGRFDLIIAGATSGSSFRRDLAPGVAYRVICRAPCPVMILQRDLPGGP